jgi:hypothetical protein
MNHVSEKHYSTPQKERIKSQAEILENSQVYTPGGHRITKKRLFRDLNVPTPSETRICSDDSSRRHDKHEARGRKPKISDEEVQKCERLLWDKGYDRRLLDWNTLVQEADLNVCGKTLQRRMSHLGYRRCSLSSLNYVR